MNEKYLKHTIMNLCEEASAMLTCGKREEALDTLKAASCILNFERWNRPNDFFTPMYNDLHEIIRKASEDIIYRIVF